MNAVKQVIHQYPEQVQSKLLHLRALIYEVADSLGIESVEETLKWGEPSYLVKGGSTIRFDWKKSKPGEYAIYLNCKTRLVETFREFYGHELTFEGNRAIVFRLDEGVPKAVLKHCIKLAMTYHKIKHLPTLGV